MSPITRRLLVGAVAVGATAALGVGLASAQTESPPTTQSPPTTPSHPPRTPDTGTARGVTGDGGGGDGGGRWRRPLPPRTPASPPV